MIEKLKEIKVPEERKIRISNSMKGKNTNYRKIKL